MLELLVAVRAVPEEPGGRAGFWLQALGTPAGTWSSVPPQRPAPCSPVLPGVQPHGLGEGPHCLLVVALLGSLVAVACRESIACCQPSREPGSPVGGAERCPSTRRGHVCLLGTGRAAEGRWQRLRLHPITWERSLETARCHADPRTVRSTRVHTQSNPPGAKLPAEPGQSRAELPRAHPLALAVRGGPRH